MANYYWVGATASAGISRYDFNTPANWQTLFWNSNTTGGAIGWTYQGATSCPGVGDHASVGVSVVHPAPYAISPLLYGGYSGNSAFGEWSNAIGSTGTTLNSSLATLAVDMSGSRYPFNYFGGGLTGDVYAWAVTSDGLTTTGFVGATGLRAVQPMKLKVNRQYMITTKASSLADILQVKSVNIAPGTTGTSLVSTSMNIMGTGVVKVKGGSFSMIQNFGTGTLHLSGLTCGEFRTVPSSVFVNTDTRFSNVYIDGAYTAPMWFGGSLDTPTVMADLGFVGSATGNNAGSNDSGIIVSPVSNWWSGAGLTTNPVLNFGMPGITSAVSFCKKIVIVSSAGSTGATVPASAARWNLVFAGGASATSIEVDDATVRAQEYIDPTVTVSIGTLGMTRNSVLDFAHEGQFDNWFFGSITGNQVNGGIVFRDETPIIRGSAGVRLFNTQIVLGNRVDIRTGKITNTSSTLSDTSA